jgi:CHAT domain-containing protein
LQNKIDPISIQNYLNNSFAAYLILIQPIKDKLTKELVIIPDKNLSYLSFDALVTNQATTFTDAQYLIDDYQVSYEYSTKLWTYMKGKRGHYAKNLIAFSPDFPNPNFDWRKVDSIAQSYVLRDGLWELVYSKKECENIAKIWDTKLVFDGSATLSNFIQMAPSYQIIHLSTHGLADDRAGEFSYMAFTHVSDTMANKLYMRDLYGLKLNADLVVLSACQTGIGEYKNGEGVVSMALGFAYAGCKSIISTLWSVNDKSTEDIITSFYRYLKEGKSKDESLRLAKMDYRKANPHAGPYLWAAFIAVGDMEPIKDGWISWTYLLWAIGLVLVGLGLYKFISRSRQNELFE